MAQQSKITSRPLTKALGTASILGMAIAGANFANAIQTDFGVDYRAQAFVVDSEAFGGSSDTDTGLANLLRLKANFKHEDSGVSLHTSIELAGDRWSGDTRTYTTASDDAYNASNRGDNVRLDTAFVRIPYGNGAVVNVGRQATSWNNCFLVCDDRRDRINTVIPTSLGVVVLGYDRRQDLDSFYNADNGDMVNAGLITKIGGFTTGLLYVHWLENTDDLAAPNAYAIPGMHLFSPYVSGKLTDTVSLDVGMNWQGSAARDAGNGTIYSDSSTAEYLRLGFDLDMVDLGFQVIGAQDGGLISGGFDTFSSVINNNPESTANPTSLYQMGGVKAGLEDFDEYIVAARAGFDVSPRLTLTGAVGMLNVDDGTDDDSSMFYDLQASYMVNEAVTTSATWGMLTKNDVGTTRGNTLVPGSGGASFEDDDLMAASLNVNVKF